MLLVRGGEKYSWEKQMSEYTIEDIDMVAFKSYLAKAVGRIEFSSDNPTVVLEKLNLFAKDGIHLLNAGAHYSVHVRQMMFRWQSLPQM